MTANRYLRPALTAFVMALLASAAHASAGGTALPWDTGISAFVSNIQGPIAHYSIIGLLVVTGIIWAATEHTQGVKWLLKLIMGGSVAVGVVDFANTFGIFGAIA